MSSCRLGFIFTIKTELAEILSITKAVDEGSESESLVESLITIVAYDRDLKKHIQSHTVHSVRMRQRA